jgi:hypothetical protein
MPIEQGTRDKLNGLVLPFGYYVELESDLLFLRRPDGTLVAAFSARGVDPYEVEWTVWKDAG